MKKLKILLLPLLFLNIFICNNEAKSQQDCIFENPLTDLAWLKNKISETSRIKIFQIDYLNGISEFFIDYGMEIDKCGYSFDCAGNEICHSCMRTTTCKNMNIDCENSKFLYDDGEIPIIHPFIWKTNIMIKDSIYLLKDENAFLQYVENPQINADFFSLYNILLYYGQTPAGAILKTSDFLCTTATGVYWSINVYHGNYKAITDFVVARKVLKQVNDASSFITNTVLVHQIF
jgi:hypothetical protein